MRIVSPLVFTARLLLAGLWVNLFLPGFGVLVSNSIATLASPPPTVLTSTNSAHSGTPEATLVHKLFEGTLTSETRCLTCETVRGRFQYLAWVLMLDFAGVVQG